MPTTDPVILARNRLSNLYSNGRMANPDKKPDPAKVAAARRELTEAKLSRAIREAVASAPPLTGEQKARLAALLLGGGDRG